MMWQRTNKKEKHPSLLYWKLRWLLLLQASICVFFFQFSWAWEMTSFSMVSVFEKIKDIAVLTCWARTSKTVWQRSSSIIREKVCVRRQGNKLEFWAQDGIDMRGGEGGLRDKAPLCLLSKHTFPLPYQSRGEIFVFITARPQLSPAHLFILSLWTRFIGT